jgi:nicotinate-nucleotide adenylyltransferase
MANTAPSPPAGVDAAYLKIPHAEKGMAIGLFGGSFNPPHSGHALVCETALRRLRLDRIWWMVTPGNPLKDTSGLLPLADRLAMSEKIARDPRIEVTAFEASHRIRYTADTLALLARRYPDINFVWLMGSDNMRNFHLWQRWQAIAATFPIAIIDRPGSTLSFLSSRMAIALHHARVDESDAGMLARMNPPAWTFIHGPRSSLSSTLIRARQGA